MTSPAYNSQLLFDRPVASTATVREGQSGAAARADHDHGDGPGSSSSVLPYKDTLTLSATTATWTLTYTPITYPTAHSLHVKCGSASLIEGTDYTVSGQVVSILAGSGLASGDALVARYFYSPGVDATWVDVVTAKGPLAWYRMNDVSNGGTMTDSSGNAHHGTWNAVTSHTRVTGLVTGDSDGALRMTGAGGEGATVPYGSWMNLASGVTWVILIDNTTDTSARLWAREQSTYVWSIQFGGAVYFLASGALIATSNATTLNDNGKHMIVITYDLVNVRIYIDGVIDKTQPYTTALPTPTNPADIFTIGYGGGITSAHMYAGDGDEFIFDNEVYTPADVAALWAAAN